MKAHFHDYEKAAYEVMYHALVEHYLKTKNFVALSAMIQAPSLRHAVLSKPPVKWTWMHASTKGDYFVAEEDTAIIESLIVQLTSEDGHVLSLQDMSLRGLYIEKAILRYQTEYPDKVCFMPNRNQTVKHK